ncbi:hypothetical protein GCM10023093_00850 [Nemorincola caseinilytica]|uniref:Sulfotransferase family protein n=1 Tax=Nemorincola caseinilytica TaxID=2054315 RepID=A0ABP8N1B7_9BACT
MACRHKFHSYLHLERLEHEPTTLIVGTFDPEWPTGNTAEWFYGRTGDSYFWNVLPRLYGGASLINASPAEWKRFCSEHGIALTDLIASIDDADPHHRHHPKMLGGFQDKAFVHNFDDFTYVDIVRILQRYPTIRNVYLTRGMTEAFWRHLWTPVMRYCNLNGMHERKLVNPSGSASFQHELYNSEHPDDERIESIEDYILMRWREEWHF